MQCSAAPRRRPAKPEDNFCDALVGHYTAGLCHLGNIPYQVGKEVPPGDVADAVKGNKEAMDSFERLKEHLAANETAPGTKITLGPSLQFDPKAEKFVGDFADAANKFVKRNYRKPYEIPEQV